MRTLTLKQVMLFIQGHISCHYQSQEATPGLPTLTAVALGHISESPLLHLLYAPVQQGRLCTAQF